LVVVGEIVDPDFLVRVSLNNFSKPWGSFVRGIVAREVMRTWERLWDDFVQEELRCISRSSGLQCISEGDEDLALWTKGKKKTDRGARQGPKGGAKPQHSGGGQERDMSTVRCFSCGEMGHYAGQCPKKKKKKQQEGTVVTIEEAEFIAQFERECAFVSCCSPIDTPSNGRWGDRVEEELLTQSIDLEGAQTQFSRTPSLGVTGPLGTTSVSELPSRQRIGATTSEHQRLMRRSRASQRLGPHLAMEMSRLASSSTSCGSHLVRDQVEDLGEMPRSRYSW
jgi:hypothetical protein